MPNTYPYNISIVTVINNAVPFLDEYFASIAKTNFSDLEIILVDSDLFPDTPKKIIQIQKKFKRNFTVTHIQSKKTVGFSVGNNIGVNRAKGKYVFLLNPDTKLDKKCLEILFNTAETLQKKSFILIPRQNNYTTGAFLIDGICVDFFGFPRDIYNTDKPNKTKPPFYCDGAAIFLPRKTYNDLGQFDSELFVYAEDIDLSWKAHLLAIPLINASKAIVFHYGGGTTLNSLKKSGKSHVASYFRRYLTERNTLRNLLKNYRVINTIWIIPLYLCINVVEIVVFLLLGKFRVSLIYLRSWWWNIQNIQTALEKRRWIQQRRVVGDWEILKYMYFTSGKLKSLVQLKIPKFQ